ncbi:MAG: hypothetical protein ALECFALPRED_007335 [Alectoria fallacina]|uniref:Uncharacterized protein n=1 Tax=Alectoria fallacina TaxID=1903189 RepID=A0A8H3EZ59_9LECA|nr:MAG: hypothetical protein ALECFALPRED_007335 [Alectoria fallacina]
MSSYRPTLTAPIPSFSDSASTDKSGAADLLPKLAPSTCSKQVSALPHLQHRAPAPLPQALSDTISAQLLMEWECSKWPVTYGKASSTPSRLDLTTAYGPDGVFSPTKQWLAAHASRFRNATPAWFRILAPTRELETAMYEAYGMGATGAVGGSTVFAKPLQAVDDQTLQADPDDLRLPSQSSNLPLTSNATSPLVNTSVSLDVSIECDGDEYGFKPDVDDCTNALGRQLVGREQIRFGQRGSISSEKFFPLPYRLMGKMLKDEALCYLQPVLLNGAEFGSASLSQLRDAASELLLRCASSMEQGGMATNIGVWKRDKL